MSEAEAIKVMESWGISEADYDLNGCIEDIMDGMDPVGSKSEILLRNGWMD